MSKEIQMHHLASELAARIGFLWRVRIQFKNCKHFLRFGVKLREVHRFVKDLMTKVALANESKREQCLE